MAPDVNLDAKGVFYGLTLMHKKGHFIRSIMESLGYIICRNLEAIEAMGLDVDEIRTMGGGSKSPLWNQIKSDITGKSLLTTYSAQDTACLGAAILAGKAAGLFESVGRYGRGLFAHNVVGIHTGCILYADLFSTKCISKPAQTHSARRKGMHHVGIRQRKIVDGHLSVRIIGKLCRWHANRQRRANIF